MKGDLKKITVACFEKLGTTECSKMVDRFKELGYKYSTIGSLTINVFDMEEPPKKKEILESAVTYIFLSIVMLFLTAFIFTGSKYVKIITRKIAAIFNGNIFTFF